MSDAVKGIIIALVTAAVLGAGALLWSVFSSGVEAEIGANPAFAKMQIQIDALEETDEGFKELHGTMNTAIAVNGVRAEDAVTGVNQLRGAILNQ